MSPTVILSIEMKFRFTFIFLSGAMVTSAIFLVLVSDHFFELPSDSNPSPLKNFLNFEASPLVKWSDAEFGNGTHVRNVLFLLFALILPVYSVGRFFDSGGISGKYSLLTWVGGICLGIYTLVLYGPLVYWCFDNNFALLSFRLADGLAYHRDIALIFDDVKGWMMIASGVLALAIVLIMLLDNFRLKRSDGESGAEAEVNPLSALVDGAEEAVKKTRIQKDRDLKSKREDDDANIELDI